MAIDFGNATPKTSDNSTSPNQALDDTLAKAKASLQKFAGPIFQTAAKKGWGSTENKTSPGDPVAAQKIMDDIPSTGETILGAVTGAMSGMQAGGSTGFGLGYQVGGDQGSADTGKSIGSIIGGALGAFGVSSSGSRTGMTVTSAVLGKSAEQAAAFETQTRGKIAQDAVASMSQRMGELAHPTSPEEAVQFAAEKDKLVNDTAVSLVAAGVAPDKAMQTSKQIAAINDPQGRYSDAQTQAASAWADYAANPDPTAEDKATLRNKLNGVIIGESIRQGKMPANMQSMLFGSGSMQPQAPSLTPGGGGPSSSGDGGSINDNGLDIQPVDNNGDPTDTSGDGMTDMQSADPTQYSNAGDAKVAQVGGQAMDSIGQMLDMIQSGTPLPQGAIDGKQWDVHEKGIGTGVSAGTGAAAGAAALSFIPGLGTAAGAGIGALGGGVLGSLGSSIGKGTTLGIPEEEQQAYTQFKTLGAVLSQQLGATLGGRMTPEIHNALDIVSSPYSSNSDREVALKTLQAAIQSNLDSLGTTRTAKTAKVKAPKPGFYMFS